MGIQYYGLGQASRTAWEDFFHATLKKYIEAGGVLFPPTPALLVEQERDTATDAASSVEFDLRATPNFYDEPTDRWIPMSPTDEPTTSLANPAPESGAIQRAPVDSALSPVEGSAVARPLVDPSTSPAPSISWAPRDQMLVEVSLGPVSGAHASNVQPQPVLYRIRPNDVVGLKRLKQLALERGGIVVAGTGYRSAGSLAVVSIVHPSTLAEFHVPGEVQASVPEQMLTPIRFIGVTDRTKIEFDRFAESGNRPARPPDTSIVPADREMVLFYTAEEAQRDLAADRKGAVLIGVTLPWQAPAKGGERGAVR
jgi:hypothetical protein